jgi:hypothetical protein
LAEEHRAERADRLRHPVGRGDGRPASLAGTSQA